MTELNITGQTILKGWGHEEILESNDSYCVKTLVFDRVGAMSSLHFHKDKKETWIVVEGQFRVEFLDFETTEFQAVILQKTSSITIPNMVPHRLICVEPGYLIEMSTPDVKADNYRIAPGDSQKQHEDSSI